MLLGIDFDNTIVCYDALFFDEALRRGLISADVPPTKTGVRDHLRRVGRQRAWTELQGFVYGVGIGQAAPFPGLRECLAEIHGRGVGLCIISHKTRQPVLGDPCDLHEAARGWLVQQQLVDDDQIGLRGDQVFFEETKNAKLDRILQAGCTHFVDDLPEFLRESSFPRHVRRILFDPHRCFGDVPDVQSATSWYDIAGMIR